MKQKVTYAITFALIMLLTFLYLTSCGVIPRANTSILQNGHVIYLPLILTPLPAFPGAEGFGSTTVGGRGGRVIEVSNLNENGPGSFRAALQESGARIIVFRIGGTIKSTRSFVVEKPFVTIAGQTAPGTGITLRGAPLVIKTHDVIVRSLRIRIGNELGNNQVAPDGIRVEAATISTVYNVIIDHCSISWAIDENLSTYQAVSNITFQWNISSEGLKNSLHPEGIHSMGFLIYDHAKKISVHHNLFAHNNRRNPRIGAASETEVINNVVYNWGEAATHLTDDKNTNQLTLANIIGNFYKPGANTVVTQGIEIKSNMPIGTKVYVQGNIDPGRPSDAQDEWDAVSGSTIYRSLDPVVPPSNITTCSAFAAYDLVLKYAGATSPKRDAIDERIVQSVQSGTGQQIDSQQEVGGWVTMQSGEPPLDSDHDGMPDAWELSHGLNPNNVADGTAVAPSRYTYVEEYINGLISMPTTPTESFCT